jgi:hypothetical protein
MEKLFADFKHEYMCDALVIEQYRGLVPVEILGIWEKYGFGSLKNGFLKTINPNEYHEIINVAYSRGGVSVPLFATGMGDIITFEDSAHFTLVNFGKKVLDVLTKNVAVLYISLLSDQFCDRHLFWRNYPLATEKYGDLSYDECFGYVPLLGLGGKEKVENLQKVKIKEQLLVIAQLLGTFD